MLRLQKPMAALVFAIFLAGTAFGGEEPDKAPATAKTAAETETALRSAIKRLSTAGWREAQTELINGGKTAIPLLIEALAPANEEAAPPAAYNLGGHIKADAGRAPRQRTVAEVCCELLTTLITQHSNYKGELPTVDQKAWQEWWTANTGKITIGTSE